MTVGEPAGVGNERMTNQPVVLAVAIYAARADADHDFDSAWLVGQEGRLDHVGAAVVEKGADGKLEIRRHNSTAKHLAYPNALLDGAITVIAPHWASHFSPRSCLPERRGPGVGAIVDHLWHHFPRDTLRSAPTPPTRSRSSSHAIKLAVLPEFDLFPHANSTVAVSLDLRHERGPGPAIVRVVRTVTGLALPGPRPSGLAQAPNVVDDVRPGVESASSRPAWRVLRSV